MAAKIKKFLSKNTTLLVLSLVFIIGVVLRFYNLGSVPVGFHRDEAYLGYNAYSLFTTGRDMSGSMLPLHIKPFLYSPAGYAYLSIPFIYLLGLSEFSTRFASALFGSLTVLLVYFLVKKLFEKSSFATQLGIISSLLLAISPWHINLSRVATESVPVVFFITLGVIFYISWVRRQVAWALFLCFACFLLTLFIYQAPRSFLPLFAPLLFLLYLPRKSPKNYTMVGGLFFLTIVLPIFLVLLSPQLSQRINMLSIFKSPQTQLVLDEQIREDGVGKSPLFLTRVFHNKATNYSSTFLQNYFKHFSYDFLFTDAGLPDRYRIPQMGLLYIFELPLLILGAWSLFGLNRRIAMLLFGWILLAPLGSALTFDDVPNLQRTLIMFPALSIVEAVGFLQVWGVAKKRKFSYPVKGSMILVMLYGLGYYLHQYYTHQVHHRPWYRQEGYKNMITEVNQQIPNYKKIVITSAESDPAIFFLFYNAYDPTLIQQFASDQYSRVGFAEYTFSDYDCPLQEDSSTDPLTKITETFIRGEKNVLYVNRGTCKILSDKIETLSEIKRSDDTVVFKLQVLK